MNVVYLTAAAPNIACGIGNYSRKLALALRDLGVSVMVVSGSGDRVVRGGIDLPIVESWSLGSVAHIRRELLRLSPDIVHIQFPGRGFRRSLAPNVLPWALRISGRPKVVTTLHEFGTASRIGRARILFGAWRSERVIVPDDDLARELHRALSRVPLAPPVVVIPIASNLPVADHFNRETFRARYEIPENALAVGWFGLLTRDKGADVLAGALERARRKREVVLVLIGDLGDLPDRRPLLDALRTGTRVVETGILPEQDAAAALASVDAVALPFASGLSGRRTSYLAAIAQGTFVVTTSAERHGYDSGTNTRFISPGDKNELADALVEPAARRPPAAASSPWRPIALAHLKVYRELTAL